MDKKIIIGVLIGVIVGVLGGKYSIGNEQVDKKDRDDLAFLCPKGSPFYEEFKAAESDGKLTKDEFIALSNEVIKEARYGK